MKLRITLLLLIGFFSASGTDLKYPVSAIPEEMKKGVDAVVREDNMRYEIKSRSSAVFYVHEVVTILNDNGNYHARQVLGYDKNSKIVDFNGLVYDAAGKLIKKLKKSEIYDQAAFDGFSLYSDNRLKAVNLIQATYPYTVEFEYQIEYKYLYAIPTSYFGGERVSSQHASYQLIYPTDLTPRFKVFNIQNEPKKEKVSEGTESVTWVLENIKPITFEVYGPNHRDLIPHIVAAPSKFEYDGYAGDMSTWNDYAKWNLSLNVDRGELPEATKQKVIELTKGLTTVEQKAKAIYEYLQSKTRYVSIQLGIGGLQPFPASVVDETGYGDCKALSNYAVAMLKTAGIKGYYTVIGAGRNQPKVDESFPSHQFNHVVVAVPNERDTLWLECTSQTNPFGYQGTFTEDRMALMLTENGGKLIHTINYKPEQNLESRTAYVSLDEKGNARAKVRSTYQAIKYEEGGLHFKLNQSDEQKKWIEKNTDIPNFNINSYSIKEIKDKIPSAVVNLDLTLNRYASVSGKRLFVTPNLMNRISNIPEKIADRKTDVFTKFNFVDQDTVVLSIPENLYPEFLPEAVKIKSKFGEYEATFKFDAGKVTYTRRMKVWKGRFPKETYSELVDFYKNVSKADNIKLVFLNKT